MKRIAIDAALLVFGILFLNMDCHESLPPYDEPLNVFDLTLSTAFARPDDIRLDIEQTILGHKKIYFDLDLINTFDETLSDSSQFVLGEISLWWDEDPTIGATLPVMNTDELTSHVFEYPQYVLMDPGDSVRFAVWWKYCVDDEDRYMWEYIDDVWYSEDENHIYENHGPMDFTLQARLQPFPGGPAVYSNILRIRITFYSVSEK
jgi:hypothetical protein